MAEESNRALIYGSQHTHTHTQCPLWMKPFLRPKDGCGALCSQVLGSGSSCCCTDKPCSQVTSGLCWPARRWLSQCQRRPSCSSTHSPGSRRRHFYYCCPPLLLCKFDCATRPATSPEQRCTKQTNEMAPGKHCA